MAPASSRSETSWRRGAAPIESFTRLSSRIIDETSCWRGGPGSVNGFWCARQHLNLKDRARADVHGHRTYAGRSARSRVGSDGEHECPAVLIEADGEHVAPSGALGGRLVQGDGSDRAACRGSAGHNGTGRLRQGRIGSGGAGKGGGMSAPWEDGLGRSRPARWRRAVIREKPSVVVALVAVPVVLIVSHGGLE